MQRVKDALEEFYSRKQGCSDPTCGVCVRLREQYEVATADLEADAAELADFRAKDLARARAAKPFLQAVVDVEQERADARATMSTYQPWRKFQPDTDGGPHGWIQWKGTDVCLDFHCKCGALGHVDGEFAYFVKCGACGQVYELSGHVEARPIDAVPSGSCDAVVAEVDGHQLVTKVSEA